MDRQYHQTLRAGITAILFALVFRLCTEGPLQPDASFLLQYLETGQSVRFSPSFEKFSLIFAESPAPAAPLPTEPAIPSFSDTRMPDVYYGCDVQPDLEELLAQPLQWDLTEDAPAVLILSTHSTESYTKTQEHYTESSAWRTTDPDYNMLAIGARVAEILTEAGIGVVQDRELHDYPSYNGSYTHARKAISTWLEAHPTIRLVLDLHRDASGDGQGQMRPVTWVAGQSCARLMLVLGTNHDGYRENLSLALKLHAQLEARSPGIMRPLQLRSQRFNQDLSPGALLVEVGAAGNTHPEAAAAAEELARAVIALAKGTG